MLKGDAWDTAVAYWKTLKQMQMQNLMKNSEASDIEPMITYGTNPGMGLGIFLKVFQTRCC
jgi:3-isopropylmalate/(R)-2-methylmalate dehydratase large subunit